ncbi:MAG: hypothetical protein WC477_05810 [Patescibacteria group bacterium]
MLNVQTSENNTPTRLNAIRHGLLSKQALLPTESIRAFRRLRKELIGELQPATPLEKTLCERVIADIWRSRRALAIERDYVILAKTRAEMRINKNKERGSSTKSDEIELRLSGDTASLTNDESAKIRRYLSTIDRSMSRSLHELQRLQTLREEAKALHFQPF